MKPLDMNHPELRAALDRWFTAVAKAQRARTPKMRRRWKIECEEALEAVNAIRIKLGMSEP